MNPTSVTIVDFFNGKTDKARILRKLHARMERHEEKLRESETVRETVCIETQMHELQCIIEILENMK